jgi:hypothetical protein
LRRRRDCCGRGSDESLLLHQAIEAGIGADAHSTGRRGCPRIGLPRVRSRRRVHTHCRQHAAVHAVTRGV